MKDVFNFKVYKSQESFSITADDPTSSLSSKEGDTGTIKFSIDGQTLVTLECETSYQRWGSAEPTLMILNKGVDMEGMDPQHPDLSKYPKFVIGDLSPGFAHLLLLVPNLSSLGGPENELYTAITPLLEALANNDDYITVTAEVTYDEEEVKPTMKLPINDDDKLLYLLECKVNDATPDEGLEEYPDVKESLAKIAFGREAMADIPFHQYPDVTESLSKILEKDDDGGSSPNIQFAYLKYYFADDMYGFPADPKTEIGLGYSSFPELLAGKDSDIIIGIDGHNGCYAYLEYSLDTSGNNDYHVFSGTSEPFKVSGSLCTAEFEIRCRVGHEDDMGGYGNGDVSFNSVES